MKILTCVCCLILLTEIGFCGEEKPDKTAWFKGKWGVFFHYLANPASRKDEGKSAEEWSKQVDEVDVKGITKQLKEIGADYLVITIGQGSGHYLAPNKVYDEITGIKPSKCSKRDLVSDLADELNPIGIKLLVYTAYDLSWGDIEARKGLKLISHHNDHLVGLRKTNVPNDWKKNREGQIEFMWNVAKINEQWSRQWGKKVAGWWVDGCYKKEIRFPENEPPNLETLKGAVLTGNPDAIVCFNSGYGVRYYSKHEDYTAGESKELSRCPGEWVEKDGHKLRYHALLYLGRTWGQGNPRFSNNAVAEYAVDITSKGGFVSFDVPVKKNGLMPEEFLVQLKHIGDSVTGRTSH